MQQRTRMSAISWRMRSARISRSRGRSVSVGSIQKRALTTPARPMGTPDSAKKLGRCVEPPLPAAAMPLQIQREQSLQDDFLGDLGGVFVVGPGVGGPDGAVEGGVAVLEPGGALIVEVGEGALLEFGLRRALGVEPVAALVVDVSDGVGDGLDAGIVDRLLAGNDAAEGRRLAAPVFVCRAVAATVRTCGLNPSFQMGLPAGGAVGKTVRKAAPAFP
jgi:hypothetical protein